MQNGANAKTRDQNLYFIIVIRTKVKYSVVSYVSICVKFQQDIKVAQRIIVPT